jgi:predicted nucleotidyltransferase component of viral defense system
MTPRENSPVATSIRARLANLAREKRIGFDTLLIRYVNERILFRLGQSKYKSRFVLKGAMLQTIWLDDPFRPTRDIDLLAYGDSDPEKLHEIFIEILSVEADDGLVFALDTLLVEPIRLEDEYGGLRLTAISKLAGAHIKIQIDFGFGDDVVPEILDIIYPSLLDLPPPAIKAYPKETVVSEKLHAIVTLGQSNSRMKDFYDIWVMSHEMEFDEAILAQAIYATFKRRQTAIPSEMPVGLSPEFAHDHEATKRWQFFIERNNLAYAPNTFAEVLSDLGKFLRPAMMLAMAI